MSTSAANWYDSGWRYRRPILIDNSANAGVLNRYQVGATLTAANFVFSHSTGLDVRFTDSNGVTPIRFWREDYDPAASSGAYYIGVPQIPASSTKTVYMYYGNPAAGSAADQRIFEFADGFDRLFTDPALANAREPLVTPTYEPNKTGGQTVHPHVIFFPGGWHGFEYWMAITPYPKRTDRDSWENPSILVSHDGSHWDVPLGLRNPLVPAPACDHNCDPDMILNPNTGELWIYYMEERRASRCTSQNRNLLRLLRSIDGIHWSAPATLKEWQLRTEPLYVSPSVVFVNGVFRMWLVNASTFRVRVCQSSDGRNWGPLQEVNLPVDQVWHLDVRYIPSKGEYWMVYNYPRDPPPPGVIRFARSRDGVNWTRYPPTNNALSPRAGAWDSSLYRSTFVYDSDTDRVRVWYAGRSEQDVWHTGYTEENYSRFVDQLSGTGGWTLKQGSGTWTASSEQARRGSYSGKLVQQPGANMVLSKRQRLPNGFYQEWDLYDDLDGSAFKMVRSVNASDEKVGVGVWTGSSASNYVYHDKAYGYTVTAVPRTRGWHKFGLLLKPDASVRFFVDGREVGGVNGQFADANQVQIEGYAPGPTTFYVDDIRVRRWTSPEPTVSVGVEEQRPVA